MAIKQDAFPHWTARVGTMVLPLERACKTRRSGIVICASSAACIFSLNLALTIYVATRYKHNTFEGRTALWEGDCLVSKRINSGLHVIINVLSTILLGSSNYCMQVLTAPTREDVDRAHSNKRWLEIGVFSWRNLIDLSAKRTILWCLLGLSSLPLHLFYNSVVFRSSVGTRYDIYLAGEGLVSSRLAAIGNGSTGSYNDTLPVHALPDDTKSPLPGIYQLIDQLAVGSLTRLENIDCITAYQEDIEISWGDLLLVVEDPPNSIGNYGLRPADYGWVCNHQSCPGTDLLQSIKNDPAAWSPFDGLKVKYCASKELKKCRVQASLHLSTLVVTLNLIKAVIICYLAIVFNEKPLLTIGDAVSSYLALPSEFGSDMCLLQIRDIRPEFHGPKYITKRPTMIPINRPRLAQAASMIRWTWFLVLSLAGLGTMSALFHVATREQNLFPISQAMKEIGFGSAQLRNFIARPVGGTGLSGFIIVQLIANAPQLLASLMYFSYNNLVTSITGAMEWDSYARSRKGLRVSGPVLGAQRESFYLQIPYRFATPLMAGSALLHWLLSQAFFQTINDYYVYNGREYNQRKPDYAYSLAPGAGPALFWSPLATVLLITLLSFMLLALGILAAQRVKSDIPMSGNCSLVFAAACHLPEGEDKDIHKMKVQWGVTGYDADGIGHCSFSANEVTPPVINKLYA